MPITAPLLEIALRYEWLGQKCQTARVFAPVGAAFLTADPTGVGEAWWNDFKTAWRAMPASTAGSVFKTVFVREIGGGLAYGEYAIPVGEQPGVRAAGSLGEALPSFLACGVRLTVASSVTRPGSFRIPFLYEADTNINDMTAGYLALAATLAAKYATTATLGAPVALGTLTPQVVKWSATTPAVVVANQTVKGAIVSTRATTQNSRKVGRGN